MQAAKAEEENRGPLCDPPVPPATADGGGSGRDTKGRHRIMVELKLLEQEANHLQLELDQLDNVEGVSTVCQELLQRVESSPDPLLPVTTGPGHPSWDRWFEGLSDTQHSGCWIL